MLDIFNTTKKKFPMDKKKLFLIKDNILGKDFELSIVMVGNKKIKNLNKKFREKDYPTDVLSFPLSKISGEIFFNLGVATKKSVQFKMSQQKYLYYLMIHSMLHLKGFVHGKKMQTKEEELIQRLI